MKISIPATSKCSKHVGLTLPRLHMHIEEVVYLQINYVKYSYKNYNKLLYNNTFKFILYQNRKYDCVFLKGFFKEFTFFAFGQGNRRTLGKDP